MIEEILEIVTVEVETENEFERIEDAKVDTRDIVLNLTLLESPEELRAKHQVQILSNAPQKLSELTQKLDDAGYDWSTSELPVTQTELRWGSAPSWMIEEILDIIYEDEALLGDEFELDNSLSDDEHQIIIQVPFEG